MKALTQALDLLRKAKHVTAFTGAGISVESGIPPFRGENGIWNKYDPKIFDLQYFMDNPKEDWELIYKVFYKTILNAKPNPAHYALATMEQKGKLKAIITQNIDNLHQKAGSKTVYEFHGNTRDLVCLSCGKKYSVASLDMSKLPPRCECGGLLKPDFVFFGEPIPQDVLEASLKETQTADVFLVVGTTGVIYPAGEIPRLAKKNGATIIEVNIEPSEYTNTITDVFIEEKASVALKEIAERLWC
jgi:NAD-dependent deacetylase